MTRNVCRLSQYKTGVSRVSWRYLKRRIHHIISEPAWDKASNSASVLDFVTVFCRAAFQSTGVPKR